MLEIFIKHKPLFSEECPRGKQLGFSKSHFFLILAHCNTTILRWSLALHYYYTTVTYGFHTGSKYSKPERRPEAERPQFSVEHSKQKSVPRRLVSLPDKRLTLTASIFETTQPNTLHNGKPRRNNF